MDILAGYRFPVRLLVCLPLVDGFIYYAAYSHKATCHDMAANVPEKHCFSGISVSSCMALFFVEGKTFY
jgi:hypothetical protein